MDTPESLAASLAAAPEDPKIQPAALEHEFDLDYTTPAGARFRGHFKNRILTVAEWVQVSRIKATLLGGMPLTSIDGSTLSVAEMMSHMALSLVEKPGWFDSTKLHEPLVVEAVYGEVAAHQARFRGLGRETEGSGGGGWYG